MQPVTEEPAAAEPKPTTTSSSNNLLVFTGVALGALGLAIMSLSVQVKRTGDFYDFAAYSLEILKQTQFVEYAGLAALLLGLAGILSGALVAVVGVKGISETRTLFRIAILVQLIVSVGYLTAGGMVSQGLQMLDDAIYKSSGGGTAQVGTFASDAIHFQLAMFNGCCAPRGFSVETYTSDSVLDAIDMDGYVKPCSTLHRTNLENILSDGLRSCYTSTETYFAMNYSVGNNLPRICQALSIARVNIEGKTVPGRQIKVSSITRGQTLLPIVGSHINPTWGCGAGYAKAFQAIMLVWVENVLRPVSTGFLVCGLLQLFFCAVAVGWRYTTAYVATAETPDQAYVRYMKEIEMQKQVAVQQGEPQEFNHAFNPTKPLSQTNPLYVNAAQNRASLPRYQLNFDIGEKI